MISDQKLRYKDKDYKIIAIEQEFIVHPTAFGILALNKAALSCDFTAEFYLDDYRLYLDIINIQDTDGSQTQYRFDKCRAAYKGSVLIASDLVYDYRTKSNSCACFSYQNVKELVFEDGILVTSIDHNKAMYRIRKNLELGLRDLKSSKDLRCVNRFLDSALVGDYKPFRFAFSKLAYLKAMKSFFDKEKLNYTML